MIKRIKFIVLATLWSLLLTTSLGFAQAAGWYTCTVQKVGTASTTQRFVWLTDTNSAFANTAFRFNFTDIANEQMATLLTAISSGKQVSAYLAGGVMGYVYLTSN